MGENETDAKGTSGSGKPPKPTAADVSQQPAPKPENEETPAFPLSRIKAEARAFTGYSAAEVAGAFAGVADTKEVTVSDAKARVREWLRAPVQTEG